MGGSRILINGASDPLQDEDGRTVRLYQGTEGVTLVPFTTLSRLMGWASTPDEGNPDGYSVAANGYTLHVAYSRDASGQVVTVDIQVDGLPAELLPGQLTVAGDELFLVPKALETLLNAQWSFSEDTLTIAFPPKDADGADAEG